jgi:signal transduction histidine kinase
MQFIVLLPTIAFLLNTVVWSYVFGQRRKEPVNRAFLLFSAAVGGWLATDIITYLPWMQGIEGFVYRTQALFWVPIGFLFLNFAYALVGRKSDTLYGAALLSALLCTLMYFFTDFFIAGFDYYSWGVAQRFHLWPHIGISLVPSFFSASGLILIFSERLRASDPIEKKTLGLITLGGMITLIGTFVLNTVLPTLLKVDDIPRVGSSALAVFILIVFYAVTKYHFLSISVEKVAEELFEDIQDGVLLINRAGIVERENQAARRLLELDTSSVGKREVELFGGPLIEGALGHTELELDMERSNRILSVSVSTSAKSGTALGKVVILRDVTERKRGEAVLRQARDELEREMEKRTEQLRHAQKMEAIGTFAGAIAHDFNNLLAAILGFANAARNEVPEGRAVKQDLDEVILAGKRAREIVQQLLTFSRRQDKTNYQVVRIRDIVTEALKLLRVSLPTTIPIDHDIAEMDCAVRCDPTQIGQVIMNLGTNAFHAMQGMSKERLTVSLEAVEVDADFAERHPPLEPGDYTRITVSDTGRGMDGDTLTRIFDPFFTTKEAGKGTGLGLSTALGIINSHDGTITVESDVGKGSRFHVYLPEVVRESRHSAIEDELLPPGTEHILLVDDERQLQRMGKRVLEPLGYRVTTASNGAEALKTILASPSAFDVIVTDQIMPEMTGVELASEVYRLRPGLPVVLVSAGGEEVSLPGDSSSNVRAFLKKPVPTDRLSATIRAIMDSGKPKM